MPAEEITCDHCGRPTIWYVTKAELDGTTKTQGFTSPLTCVGKEPKTRVKHYVHMICRGEWWSKQRERFFKEAGVTTEMQPGRSLLQKRA